MSLNFTAFPPLKDAFQFCQRMLCAALLLCPNCDIGCLLPLLSGDIKLNLGSAGNDVLQPLESLSQAILRLETNRNTIPSQLAITQTTQAKFQDSVHSLSSLLDRLEEILKTHPDPSTATNSTNPAKLSFDAKLLTVKYDDAENRLRRSNILIFKIADKLGETWAQSEAQVI